MRPFWELLQTHSVLSLLTLRLEDGGIMFLRNAGEIIIQYKGSILEDGIVLTMLSSLKKESSVTVG
jgi:hypothetical protein